MKSELTFQNTRFLTVKKDNQVWLTSSEIANALSYKSDDAVTRIYLRNTDEFTPTMSQTVKLTVSSENCLNTGNLQKTVRVFSLRGAHLVVMFARTPIAKDFRKWVLDVLDHEVTQSKAAVLTKSDLQNLNCLCTHMAYLYGWWHQYYPAVRGFNKNVAACIYDNFNDGAFVAAALAHQFKLDTPSTAFVRQYPFDAPMVEQLEYSKRFQSIQKQKSTRNNDYVSVPVLGAANTSC